ncbi:thiol reductant ABC exporter, CydD subunit [Cryptosporangium aurantiacum]|uniref:Thiol reductant ABC exporter, CydD subunit n=1 Tax=Cryptosporangium aurantiacum TaxID=134849 RepID=A0A1M7QMH9_9ACTN|nr:thiol reductant ABC exporter subunit CydD [Cryptosporangium aurantiacum]SHN32280.1 thiol reductant ABC exporter, CydD subunit [Cryptosporangium aurantiacum]
MKPLDPRLLRYARATRWFLVASVALGTASAVLLVAQATYLASAIAGVVAGGDRDVRPELIGLALVTLGRAVLAWAQDTIAHRTGAAVISALRRALLARAVALGPAWLERAGAGNLATLATRGVDALTGYFARYLPVLILAVVVPVLLGARLLAADPLTAVVLVVTVPLIPIFMALVGWYTQSRTRRQFDALSRLSGHFLDVVAGLPTLIVFGRAKAQVATVRRITDDYRRTTLGVLRAAFLSSLVLELLATISVALVAVSIGLRLVEGSLTLEVGLLVLILAPEVYLPLRQVGAQFHASTEGLEAANQVFTVLETPLPSAGSRTGVPVGALTLENVTVRYPGRSEAALDGTSLVVRPGTVTALTGPSGAGKSTVLSVLLGFVPPDAGRVRIGGTDLADLDPSSWRSHLAWVPQRPTLIAGTIAENIRLGRPDATDAEVAAAAADADLGGFALDRTLGEDGSGLSAGERQRVGLARAFLRNAPIVLLDEPTANLDGDSEQRVLAALRRLVEGRTAVVVAHRPALVSLADHVVRMGGVRVA